MELNNALWEIKKNPLGVIKNILDKTEKWTSKLETQVNRNHPHQIIEEKKKILKKMKRK